MRRAINENPVVQAAMIGVMVILFAFLLFTRVLNQSEPAEPESTTPATATEATPGTATVPPTATAPPQPTAPGAAVPEAAPTPAPAPAPSGGGVPESALVPGKGLPANVVQAYADGKVVVLLVVRHRGIDDKPVKQSVEALRNRDDVAVFVTGAKDIARYSRITQGVSVSRVPALVVVRPRNLTEGPPEASVSYGFRGPASVVQAVEDAKYKGKKVPYYPE
jgi:hypothetical protein